VIERIKELAKKEAIEFTHHARTQMYKRKIGSTEVKQTLVNGEIIEEYRDDKPYPSFLLCAKLAQKYLHVVCAVAKEQLFIITTYYPDDDLWIAHKKRK
jgi:predicted transcriptional regulator